MSSEKEAMLTLELIHSLLSLLIRFTAVMLLLDFFQYYSAAIDIWKKRKEGRKKESEPWNTARSFK